MKTRGILTVAWLLLASAAWAQPVQVAPPTGPVISGTKSCVTSAGTLVAAGISTGLLSCTICNPIANTTNVKLGDSTPDLTMTPGMCVNLDVADLVQVYCQRVTVDTTIEFLCTKGP